MGTPEFAVPVLEALIAEGKRPAAIKATTEENSKTSSEIEDHSAIEHSSIDHSAPEPVQVVAVYTQPDKPVGRGLQMQFSPIKQVALKNHVPVFTPEKVSAPEHLEQLKQWNADFFVIVAYGQILKLPVIQTPRYGCINIHSSLLPRWRGAAPIQWAILGGDAETGVTTMQIVPKLDAGDILLQAKTKISPTETASSLHDRLSQMGAELILPTLRGVLNQTVKPQPQEEANVTYAQKLTKEMEVLDWTVSAIEIDRKVRALNPWPGTSFYWGTSQPQKIKIKSGQFRTEQTSKAPGSLFESQGRLCVACSEGIYEIFELQEEGKRSIKAQDFLNGLKGKGIKLS